MTAAAILAKTILCDEFVEELLGTWHVNPDEAQAIAAIVEKWGDEPAFGRAQADLRREIAARVTDYLRAKRLPSVVEVVCGADETASECDAPDCCTLMTASEVYAWTTIDGTTARVCSEQCLHDLSAAEVARVTCEGCGKQTGPDERHPTAAGGVRCASCELKLANAARYQRNGAAALAVLRGGRS